MMTSMAGKVRTQMRHSKILTVIFLEVDFVVDMFATRSGKMFTPGRKMNTKLKTPKTVPF